MKEDEYMNQETNQFNYQSDIMQSGTAKKQQLRLISVVIGIVCTLMILFSISDVINCSIFDIPVLQLAAGDDMEEMEDEWEDAMDQLDDFSDDEIEEFEEEYDIKFKSVEKFIRKPSMGKALKFAKIDEIGMDDDVIEILSVANIVVYIYGGIIALLMLLAALCKNRALSIISTIVSILFHIALSGMIFFVIQLVLTIAHVTVLTMAKKA